MAIKLLMRLECAGGEHFEKCDRTEQTYGTIDASIEGGGSIEIDLVPNLPPGWSFYYGGVHCPGHAQKAR